MKIIRFNAVWCPSCLVSKRLWKKIEESYPNINIIDCDYDMDEDMVLKYNVGDKLPVVIKLNDSDEEISRIVGEKTLCEIEKFIKE